jgi:hypothetical protein
MFALGIPAVLPSVTWRVAAASVTPAMTNAPQVTPAIAAKPIRILITAPFR